MLLFFFFKQKTAYEMRISDWSSDVCSSDLPFLPGLQDEVGIGGERAREAARVPRVQGPAQIVQEIEHRVPLLRRDDCLRHDRPSFPVETFGRSNADSCTPSTVAPIPCIHAPYCPAAWVRYICRSEEHTSELQSLMRTSYAVSCLKKKK